MLQLRRANHRVQTQQQQQQQQQPRPSLLARAATPSLLKGKARGARASVGARASGRAIVEAQSLRKTLKKALKLKPRERSRDGTQLPLATLHLP